MNIVIIQKNDVNTISCAAKSLSPSICLAIWKVETPVGAPYIIVKVSKAIPLNPKKTLSGIIIAGTTINLVIVTIIVLFRYFLISEKEKEAPSNINPKGVAIFDISLTVDNTEDGSCIPIRRNIIPITAAIISGLVITPLVIFLTFI